MARNQRAPDSGRVKVRVIEFEMDGSNQTLRESIRDIVGAIGRAPQVPRTSMKAIGDGKATEGQEHDGDVTDVEPESLVDEAPVERSSGPSTRRKSTPRSPIILDIDLKQGDTPLVQFLEKLNPSSNVDRSLCIAYWLKHNAGITEVSMDHIHTGYRVMTWNTPADASSPLRTMKRRDYGYMRSGSKSGMFELTHVGENHVHDLMKAAGQED